MCHDMYKLINFTKLDVAENISLVEALGIGTIELNMSVQQEATKMQIV